MWFVLSISDTEFFVKGEEMDKNDKFPQIMLTVFAVIITATILVAGYFDSPEYNESDISSGKGEIVSADVFRAEFQPESGKIDINNATLEELTELEQIGKVRAQAIIDYRNNNYGFYSVDDIMMIEEIPRSVFEKIKDKLTLGTYTEVITDVF